MSKFFAISAAISLGLVVGATAWFVAQAPSAGDEGCGVANVGGADIGGPFELTDGAGRRVRAAEVLAKPSLVYFGYTFCPDACPMDMSRNAEVVDRLAQKGHDLGLVFITLDPKRDTPAVVGDYASAYLEGAIGLSGTDEEVALAARAYRVYYKAQETGDDFYTLDHSTFTYLMLPGRGFAEFYRREASVDDMAKSVSCLLDMSN